MYPNQLESGAAKRNAKYQAHAQGGCHSAPALEGTRPTKPLSFSCHWPPPTHVRPSKESQAQRWLQSRSKRTLAIAGQISPRSPPRWVPEHNAHRVQSVSYHIAWPATTRCGAKKDRAELARSVSNADKESVFASKDYHRCSCTNCLLRHGSRRSGRGALVWLPESRPSMPAALNWASGPST
jgi:hypothetical protein